MMAKQTVAAPSNKTTPRAGDSGGYAAISFVLVVAFLISPLALIVAVAVVFLTIRQLRWHWPVPMNAGLLATILTALIVQVVTGNVFAFHVRGLVNWQTWPWWLWYLPTLPMAIPLGVVLGGLLLGLMEWATGRAEWHPIEKRRRAVNALRTEFRVQRLLTDPRAEDRCRSVPLGVVRDGDLAAWRDESEPDLAVMPKGLKLAMGLLGASGTGKTVTAERLALIWAKAGRKLVFLDFKGTDPDLPKRIIAAYRSVRPNAIFAAWPSVPFDMWRGSPGEILGRLMQIQDFSESAYHKSVAETALFLAVHAPDPEGRQIRSSRDFMERLTIGYLKRAWHGHAQYLQTIRGYEEDPAALNSLRMRYEGFFSSLGGRLDGGFSYEDADVVVVQVPSLAVKGYAEAVARILLVDYANYCTSRKPRKGEPTTCVVDEYSAVTSAAAMVVDIAERVRDVDGQIVVSAQSFQGLGETDDERRRVIAALRGGLVVHAMVDPDELLKPAGTVRDTEQSHQLAQDGASGMGSLKMHHRMAVSPDAVRQARIGEAWIISHGRALHISVLACDVSEQDEEFADSLIGTMHQDAESLAQRPELASGNDRAGALVGGPDAPVLPGGGASLLELAAGAGPSGLAPQAAITGPGPDLVTVWGSDRATALELQVRAAVQVGEHERAHDLAHELGYELGGIDVRDYVQRARDEFDELRAAPVLLGRARRPHFRRGQR